MKKLDPFEDNGHHLFSPSSSPRWLVCHGSIRAIKKLPPELQAGTESYAAREGTVAHKLCEIGLLGQDISFQLDKQYSDVLVTQEMVDFAQGYIDHVKKLFKKYSKKYKHKNVKLFVEYHVDLAEHFDGEDVGGTVDSIIMVKGHFIHVIDFKYGKGYVVGVENNTQLMIYGLCKILDKSSKYIKKTYPWLKLSIIQPRAYHVDGPIRTWGLNSIDLLHWVEHTMKPAIKKSRSKKAKFVAGEEQCMWCPMAGDCPTLDKYMTKVAQQEFSSVVVDKPIPVEGLTNKQLASILDNKTLIIKWLESIEHHATYKLEHGKGLKGYKLVAKRAHRKFVVTEQRLKGSLLAHNVDVELLYDSKMKSPNQLEKALTTKLGKEVAIRLISRFSEKPVAGLTIAKSSDARAEISSSAEQEFSHIKN